MIEKFGVGVAFAFLQRKKLSHKFYRFNKHAKNGKAKI